MEGVHGVDVSSFWNKNTSPRESRFLVHASAKSPVSSRDVQTKTPSNSAGPVKPPTASANLAPSPTAPNKTTNVPADGQINPTPSVAAPLFHTQSHTGTSDPVSPKGGYKRPGSMARSLSMQSTSSNESNGSGKSSSRKSWISSLSSKFGGSQHGQNGANNLNGSPKSPQPQINGSDPMDKQALAHLAGKLHSPTTTNGNSNNIKEQAAPKQTSQEGAEPYVPAQPKQNSPGFLSNALRRLSSSSQAPMPTKPVPNGGVCARRVMNVDPNRERCALSELDGNKLRKVSFCVDVEIAGGPVYKDDDDSLRAVESTKKNKDKKLKEKGEGAALKNPQAAADAKDKAEHLPEEDLKGNSNASDTKSDIADGSETSEAKERADAERKERSEKRRRKAEENGSLPKELRRDGQAISATSAGSNTPRPQDRPTTDPLRIYRRCCQLRETPILKRITEQLGRPDACPVATPGIVSCLDLTGSRLQLPDYYALSDWLAVVPVHRLLLEDADISDEGVRVVLAGLLAAKPPSQQRSHRRLARQTTSTSKFSADDGDNLTHERLGIVEKLSLKNNPRLTVTAWKHISLFIYMCRSIKALDVSMNRFPNTEFEAAGEDSPPVPKADVANMSEIFAKAISERLGGSRLEELMMAECSLTPYTVRKVIDAVIMCGVSRLGLAGNYLEEQSLEAVVLYLKSGVCHGLDLAGNDLRGKLDRLTVGFQPDIPIWALSLADCNLDVESLKILLPAVIKLHNLRFIDLSHNHDLFDKTPDAVPLLRRYIPQMPLMKRIHLCDVSMRPGQAIGIAEVLPEAPHLAHLSLVGNPALTRLASATEENDQEEACALYASLMSAARTSDSLMAIDIDVPTQETSEIVKALAKQIVAYCLRNMERLTAGDAMGDTVGLERSNDATNATSLSTTLSKDYTKDIETPAVLMHLIGESDDHRNRPGDDDPAPDDDYIVGGTGVVKALSYCLSEKASDMQRESPSGSGYNSPDRQKVEVESGAKARKLGKDLLGSARKIRTRIRPAMIKEARAGNDMNYRRLQFLDSTLQQTINRFETEYPELRLSTSQDADGASSELSTKLSRTSSSTGEPNVPLSRQSTAVDGSEEDDDDARAGARRLGMGSRHASDVSLASRAMGFEEGKVHRFGHKMRQDMLEPPLTSLSTDGGFATVANGDDGDGAVRQSTDSAVPACGTKDVLALKHKLEQLQGAELRHEVTQMGWEDLVKRLGHNVDELKQLREVAERGGLGSEEEADWRNFREAQEAAVRNAGL